MSGTRPIAAAAFLLATLLPAPTPAESNLRPEMNAAAKEIAVLAAKYGASEVDLTEILFQTEDSKLYSAAGAGIALVLAEELRSQKIVVAKGSRLRITGQCEDVVDSQSKLLAAHVQLRMIDPAGKELGTVRRGVFGEATLASLFGATVDLAPKANVVDRDRQMSDALSRPNVLIDRALVRPSRSTPYAVEVLGLVDDRYQPKEASAADGQAFVTLAAKQKFAIRLTNASEREAAVSLAIDGISLFAFSEVSGYSQILIPARSSAIVGGWFLGGKPLLENFLPGAYPATNALKEIPRVNGPGVITAVFSVSYPDDVPPPEDEPVRPSIRSVVSDPGKQLLLTNRLLEVEPSPGETPLDPHRLGSQAPVSAGFRSRFVEQKRNFGVVRTAISIRFEKASIR